LSIFSIFNKIKIHLGAARQLKTGAKFGGRKKLEVESGGRQGFCPKGTASRLENVLVNFDW